MRKCIYGYSHLTTGPSYYKIGVLWQKLDFFAKNWDFGPKKNHFSAERKNGHFSVIPAWTGSVVILGHGSTKFRSKIKGTYTSSVGMAQKGKKQGWAPKNDP